jgi:Sulfotransferase domain
MTESSIGAAANEASSDWALLDPLTMRARKSSRVPLPARIYKGLTSPVRLLPDFLIIGTQRGGTTALYHYLRAHPCITTAITPDIHFFDKKYSRGLAWYRGHFPTLVEKYYAQHLRERAFVTGEACSSYLFYPHTSKRVASILPRVKLIVLLRNPVDRAYSQCYHALELGYETLSFEEAIRREEERIAGEREKILQDELYYSNVYMHLSYLKRGIYVDQLREWMSFFPRERFLILKSEDFFTDPVTTYKRVLAFLNVPEVEPQVRKKEYKHYSHNTYFSQMDPALRRRLNEYFEPHNARLYDFLGVDFGWEK